MPGRETGPPGWERGGCGGTGMEADAPELSLGRSPEQGILRPGPVPVRSLFVIQEPGIPGTDRI